MQITDYSSVPSASDFPAGSLQSKDVARNSCGVTDIRQVDNLMMQKYTKLQ